MLYSFVGNIFLLQKFIEILEILTEYVPLVAEGLPLKVEASALQPPFINV
jgi:hypothetical protein